MKKTYTIWFQRKEASILILDVINAFHNISHRYLIYNFWKKQFDPKMIAWIARFIQN